jgi:hypothetical protein
MSNESFTIVFRSHEKDLDGPDQGPEEDENQKAELGEQTDTESETGDASGSI